MRRRGLVVASAFLFVGSLLLVGVAGAGGVTVTGPAADEPSVEGYAGFDVERAEREFRDLVDEERGARGLDPLATDDALGTLSRSHSLDMADREFVGHETPDGVGFESRIEGAGLDRCGSVGENVARVYVDRPFEVTERYHPTDEGELAAALLSVWLESPEHRENLLSDEWERQAIGIVATPDGTVYATHHFCS